MTEFVPDIEFPVLSRVKRISQDYARKHGPKKVKPVDIILQVGALIAAPALAGRGAGAALEESLAGGLKPDILPYEAPPYRPEIPIETLRPEEVMVSESVGSSFIDSSATSFVNPSYEELPVEETLDLTIDRVQKPNNLKTRVSTPKPGRGKKRGEIIELHQLSPNTASTRYANIEETIFQKPAARTRATQNYRDVSLGEISRISNASSEVPLLLEETPTLDSTGFEEVDLSDVDIGFANQPTIVEEGPDGLEITVPKSGFAINSDHKGATGGQGMLGQRIKQSLHGETAEEIVPVSEDHQIVFNSGGIQVITRKRKRKQRAHRKLKKPIFPF